MSADYPAGAAVALRACATDRSCFSVGNKMAGDALAWSTVLQVADEPLIAMMIEASLVDAGAEVLWASNQVRACELIEVRADRIDVLVTDIILGGRPHRLRRCPVCQTCECSDSGDLYERLSMRVIPVDRER
jgi:hypothetical protein